MFHGGGDIWDVAIDRLYSQAILMLLPCSSNGTGKAIIKDHIIGEQYLAGARGENQISLPVHVKANKNPSSATFCLLAVGFVVCDPVTSYGGASKDSKARYQGSFAKEELIGHRGCFCFIL
jgi:hypothetical protein